MEHENSWPFRKPVDQKKVPDYYDVIKNPMDLETAQKKLKNKEYTGRDEFRKDIMVIFENARTYNSSETIYYKYAN